MLNRCPSCQASVLDDDAETCPFCGSPMDPAKAKGFTPPDKAASTTKREPKATAPAAGPAKTSPAAPAAKSCGGGKTAPAAKPSSDREDPFAADASASSAAIPLSRKPTPQRPHKVVCPMCDTAGYAPTAASGKEVRCAKPDCMVPVFTSPDFAAPKAPEPEPKSALSPGLLATVAALVLLLGGGAVWWFVLREPPRSAKDDFAAAHGGAITTPPPKKKVEPTTPTTEKPTPVAPTAPPLAETLAAVTKRWPDIAESIVQPERQAQRRRFAAESYAIAGQVEPARDQIQKMDALRGSSPFYKISPLAELAWLSLAKGDEAGAKAAFDESVPLTSRIPSQGFDPTRIAIDWTAASARFGQPGFDVARATSDDDATGDQLQAALRSAALFSKGDLAAEHGLRPVRTWNEPKLTAATFELLRRGARDAARAFAGKLPQGVGRAENYAAWAEATLLDDATSPEQRQSAISETIASLAPGEQAYVLARAAVRAAGNGDKASAGQSFAAATAILEQLPAPVPLTGADMAELARYDLSTQGLAWVQAAAFGEAAHAAALLDQADKSTELLGGAFQHAAAIAPPRGAFKARQEELSTLGISGVEERLKSDLNLPANQAGEAAREYRRKLNEIEPAVGASTLFKSELLARAVGWGLGPKVLALAKQQSDAAVAQGGDSLLTGAAGGRLIAAYELAGNKAVADEVRAAGATNRDVPPVPAIEVTIEPLLKEGKGSEAARELFGPRFRNANRSDLLAFAIRSACRLMKERSVEEAFTFTTALSEQAMREEALRALAACAGETGQGHLLGALLQKSRLNPTEQASALRGLTQGLVAAGAGSQGAIPTAKTP